MSGRQAKTGAGGACGFFPLGARASSAHTWQSDLWTKGTTFASSVHPTADRYLDQPPWRPDYQARLVRNDPLLLAFPAETHKPITVIGPRRYLEAPPYHADCILTPPEDRAAKAWKYERLRPGKRMCGRPMNVAYYATTVEAPR